MEKAEEREVKRTDALSQWGKDGSYCSALTNYCHETIPTLTMRFLIQLLKSRNMDLYITYPIQNYWQSIEMIICSVGQQNVSVSCVQ